MGYRPPQAFDPCLSLGGQAISYIGTSPIKFLGYTIQVPLATDIIRNKLLDKLKKMLQQVDEIPVTRHQKLLLYRAAICPRLNWDLAVNDLPLSWVTNKLEAEATKYLKKWSGLAKPADTSRLYLPKPYGGLGLPAISLLFKKQQISQACQILTSHDPIIRHTATIRTQQEESLQRPKLKPMLAARDALKENPGANGKKVRKRAKTAVVMADAETRLEHAKSLQHQGELFRSVEDGEASSAWSSAVLSLPP